MRKHFKFLLSVCLLVFSLALSVYATDFTGYTPISSADDLLALMNSTSAVTGKYYLTKDIDLTGKTQSPIGEPNGKSFGTASSPAVFDGNGYTVKGVNISGGSYTGFFGVVDNVEIRNLTIKGSVTSSGSNSAALVAYAKTKAIIENCVNECTFSTTGTGASFGGILGNTELSSIAELTISSCTNNGKITGYRVVGGIVGNLQRAKNSKVVIEKCVNNGAVSATCTSSDSKAGGILGASNRGNTTLAVTSFEISKCMNTAKISGYFYVAGIVGELCGTDDSASYVYSNAKFHVKECFNSGEIVSTRTSTGAITGGIIGYISQIGDVQDCLNTGTVSAKIHQVGGIFGYGENKFIGAKNNLNRADVLLNGEAVTNSDYVNSIGGYMPYKPYGVNYYTGTLQGKVWANPTTNAKSTQYTPSLFGNLNENGVWTNPDEPELIEFVVADCEHEEIEFVRNSTSIDFNCTACGETVYTDTDVSAEVYVSENGHLASEACDMGTSEAPFKSLTEAFEYAALAAEIVDDDATIKIVDTAVLEDTYTTPATDKTITVTGGIFYFGGELIANRHFNLGGPMVFENITFTSAAKEVRVNAQNNKLVMGEGIVMGNATSTTKVNSSIPFAVNDVKMFVSGGFYEVIPDTMATDITIRSGEYYIITGWNATNSKTATMGTAKVTIGKTNDSDVLKVCDLVAFSTVAQTRMTADSTATVIIDGDADIARIMMSEREKTTNTVEANYITHLILRGNVSEAYRSSYMAPYGVDITGGSHTDDSLGYHTFRIFTDERVDGAVLLEHAFFGGDGYSADETLTTGGYKPVSEGGDVTMTRHSYKEYCIAYLGGHTDGDDADTLCENCGADVNCEHLNAAIVTEKAPNCAVKGYYTQFCHDCGIMVSEGELPLDDSAHEYAWEAVSGGYRYACIYDSTHVYCTYDKEVTEFYVSDDGKADGGFTEGYPSNDFDSVMRLAAASDKTVTVNIVGSVTLKNNSDTDYEVYIEPEHTNNIIVKGSGKNLGIIKFTARNVRLEYMLSGDTAFEQIEFDTGISTNAIYIVARHNRLVMGEKITSTFGRHTSTTSNSGKVNIIGGCDNTVDKAACSKTDTDITFKSGAYYMVIGGSSSKACGLVNGTINIKVLGDIKVGGVVTNQNGYVDRQFILGSHSASAGDVVMVIDGNITCTNAFCIGSYGTTTVSGQTVCRTVKDVTLIVKSGSVTDYSFGGRNDMPYIFYDEEFAKIYEPNASKLPVSTVVIFPFGSTHSHAIRGGVMNFVDNLYVTYNSDDSAALTFAKRLRMTLGGVDNFHMEVISDNLCIAAGGRHTPKDGGVVELEPTCKGEGSIKHICATCGKTYKEKIARLPHNLGAEVLFKEADCVSPTIYAKSCENDGCSFMEYVSEGAPTGVHVYEDGLCIHCARDKQDLCTHQNLSEVVKYTSGCGKGTKQVCLDCEKAFIDIDSADHVFGKYTVTVEPTGSTPGVKSRTCKHCGKIETSLLYSEGASGMDGAIAFNSDGSLANLSVDSLKLSRVEKEALNALLQNTSYGSEVKVSYVVDDAGTDIVYSIPMPAEYYDMTNIKIVVRDDNGEIHTVDFKLEKGYIVFTF